MTCRLSIASTDHQGSPEISGVHHDVSDVSQTTIPARFDLVINTSPDNTDPRHPGYPSHDEPGHLPRRYEILLVLRGVIRRPIANGCLFHQEYRTSIVYREGWPDGRCQNSTNDSRCQPTLKRSRLPPRRRPTRQPTIFGGKNTRHMRSESRASRRPLGPLSHRDTFPSPARVESGTPGRIRQLTLGRLQSVPHKSRRF